MSTRPQLMRAAVAASALLGVTICATAQAQQPAPADQNPATETAAGARTMTQAYLGVDVEPLHPSMIGHLAESLGAGRGVIVADVGRESPAERAGLKPNDIIVSFNDQDIYSPLQFSQLVRYAKPGTEVTLGVVRSGQSQQTKVTLGQHQVDTAPRRAFRLPLIEQQPWISAAREDGTMFDSLTVARLDSTHFKAEINFRDNQGKIDKRTFQGTLEEIRRDIDSERNLPPAEREHLLRALNLPGGRFEFDMPGITFEQP